MAERAAPAESVAPPGRAAPPEGGAPPERVLLTTMRFDPHFGGVENSLRELSRALSARGHQVRIVASASAPAGAARPARRSRAYGADVVRFPYLGGPLVGLSVLAAAITLARTRHTFRPTRVVTRHHYTALALWLAGYRDVTYVVPTVTDRVQRVAEQVAPGAAGSQRSRARLAGLVQRFVLARARRVVTLSGLMADLVAREGGLSQRPTVCPPGVDRARYLPATPAERAAERERLGLPRDARIVVCLGRFVPEKGLDLALAAAEVLQGRWTLVLVGDGAERTALEARAAASPADVLVHPSTPWPERYLRASDAFVLPSRYEPFGQVLLEAVACGLPVAAFATAAGVETATAEVFAEAPCLVRFAERLEGADLAAAIAATEGLAAQPCFATQRETFLRRFDWRHLVELISDASGVGRR